MILTFIQINLIVISIMFLFIFGFIGYNFYDFHINSLSLPKNIRVVQMKSGEYRIQQRNGLTWGTVVTGILGHSFYKLEDAQNMVEGYLKGLQDEKDNETIISIWTKQIK